MNEEGFGFTIELFEAPSANEDVGKKKFLTEHIDASNDFGELLRICNFFCCCFLTAVINDEKVYLL